MSSLSRSILWDKMREYYSEMGPSVWQQEIVPLHITSNKYLSEVYVSMIVAHIKDCIANKHIHSKQPFYILEIGAGHGKFSYYVLKSLIKALELHQMPSSLICYVITDISPKNIESCAKHPRLKPYVEQGVLDFACYNAEADESLNLMHKQISIGVEQLLNPMFIICNYLFDTLSHDAFQVEHDELFEVQVHVSEKDDLPQEQRDGTEHFFANVAYKFVNEKTSLSYYDDPILNAILKEYIEIFERASLLMPIGGFRCLKNIARLTRSHFALLMADKGVADTDLFDECSEPDIAEHGSISMMVNIDALARYFRLIGGFSLLTSNKSSDFQVAFFCSNRNQDFPESNYNFNQHVNHFSPHDLFALCYDKSDRQSKQKSIDQLIAVLQLSRWDPATFIDLNDMLIDQAKHMDDEQRLTLIDGVKKAYEYFFRLEDTQDLPFEVGRLLYAVDEFEQALDFFYESLKQFGESEDVYYNLALCFDEMEQIEKAKQILEHLLESWPQHKDAKRMLKELTKQ